MNFLETRTAFIFFHGSLLVQDADDHRSGHEWLMDYNIQGKMWEESVRGYFCPGIICFFMGRDYHPCPNLTFDYIDQVLRVYATRYAVGVTDIRNGVVEGREGEVWEPLQRWDSHNGQWVPVQ